MIVVRGLGNVANTVDVVSLSTSTLSVTLEFVSLIPRSLSKKMSDFSTQPSSCLKVAGALLAD